MKAGTRVRAIVADRWFDGRRFQHRPVVLHLAGEIIETIEPLADDAPPPPAGARPDAPSVIDARGRVVLPGLVNAHTHIARAGFFEADEPPLQVTQVVKNLQGALASGTTTVADMGCTMPMLERLRRVGRDDPLAMPRVVGAGPVMTAPEGYPFTWISPLWRHAEAALPIDDERSACRAVDRAVERGMDHIKIAVMHESFAREPLPALTVKAATAVVGEARQLGRRVFAHAHSNRDYEVALEAGVDGLMHSSFDPLTAELVRRIADAGVPVNPTLWAYDGTCQVGACHAHRRADLQKHATPRLARSWSRFADAYAAGGDHFPADSVVARVKKADALAAMRTAAANLRLLHDAGVPIVFGNDASFGVALLARPYDELAAMQRAGLDVVACLVAATSGAADLLGLPGLGRIAPNAAADLVIAPAELEHDLAALDADRPGVRLQVIARGLRVPTTTSPARFAKIAAAYLGGTASTLGHTLSSWARSSLFGSPRT